MKKILTLVLALVLVLAMAVPTFALSDPLATIEEVNVFHVTNQSIVSFNGNISFEEGASCAAVVAQLVDENSNIVAMESFPVIVDFIPNPNEGPEEPEMLKVGSFGGELHYAGEIAEGWKLRVAKYDGGDFTIIPYTNGTEEDTIQEMPAMCGTVDISGSVKAGSTVTASVTDFEELDPEHTAYTWVFENFAEEYICEQSEPQSGKTFTISSNYVGWKVHVEVTDDRYYGMISSEAVTVGEAGGNGGGNGGSGSSDKPVTPVSEAGLPFTDVNQTDWSYSAIKYVYEKKLMNGLADVKFGKADKTTRAMVVTTLYRLAGEPDVENDSKFADVKAGSYYEKAVAWAYEQGIVKGYNDTAFGPEDMITREQLTVMLYNFAKFNGEGFTGSWYFLLPFDDRAEVSSWADEAAHWCSMKGIVNGMSDKIFSPKGDATREQMAAMLWRLDSTLAK